MSRTFDVRYGIFVSEEGGKFEFLTGHRLNEKRGLGVSSGRSFNFGYLIFVSAAAAAADQNICSRINCYLYVAT